MQLKQLGRIALLVAVLLLVVSIGSSVQAQGAKPASIQLYTGKVTDKENEFVGIAISEGTATIYICDGQADKNTISIAEWFIGPVKDNAVDITAPTSNRVVTKLTDTSAEGQFTFKDGTVKKFNLKRAEGDTGLYRSEFTFGNLKFVGGWLVLPDGSVRGGQRNVQDGSLSPATFHIHINPAAPPPAK